MSLLRKAKNQAFQPQSELAADASQLEPLTGKQFELGAKVSLMDERLNGQVAIYRLDDENRAEDDLENPDFFVASGEARTRGLEFSLTGSPLDGLDLALGYAYVDTDLDSDPTPEHSATAFAKYTFQDGTLRGWYTGLGIRSISSFESVAGEVTKPGVDLEPTVGPHRLDIGNTGGDCL